MKKNFTILEIAIVSSIALMVILAFVRGCDKVQRRPPMASVTNVLSLSFRYSLMVDKTLVLQIENKTDQDITGVELQYLDQSSHKRKNYRPGRIKSKDSIEVGILENGWAIRKDQVVTVTLAGYPSVELYVYEQDGALRYAFGYENKKADQIGHLIGNILK